MKFNVQESHIRALEAETNGNVGKDSCCESFCAFNDKGYYNTETNCIGTQLIGWGANKEITQE
ncbi:carbohydrate-binding family 9-like protein [Marinilabilia sp.]|uniref:carbohydrate-binding family 9-like protein n=1 Tax=Marinilabilia sp. TaxID=2021252 RepID=UPI0025BA5900|nr:carbohydrate-binding family 9-like protein [Marinilabilia sp.]